MVLRVAAITAMKLAANAGPMPAPLAIVGQAYQMEYHATKTVLSEHKCHRTPFALLTKRCGSSAVIFGSQHCSPG